MKCKFCKKEFSTQIALLQHQQDTSCGQSGFKCRNCKKDFCDKVALLQHVAAAHPKGSGGAVAGGGAVGGVYRVLDIQEIRVSILETTTKGWWAVGQSANFNSGGFSTWNLSTTIESDGRGHFIFSSTGQRFQGTTTNDGETKVFRPTQRVVIDGAYVASDGLDSSLTFKGVLECVRATMRP